MDRGLDGESASGRHGQGRLFRAAYVLLTYLAVPPLLAHLFWRGLSVPGYRRRVPERFGLTDVRLSRPSIWVHAVSVGEVQAAAPLIRSLLARHPAVPLVLTTMTPTGAERAQALFGDAVVHSYVPYDVSSAVRRFFDRVRPTLAIIMETELWPNLWHECGRRRVPLVLASARMSVRSVRRYRRLVPLFRQTLSHGIVIAAQTAADADRFLSLGANPASTHVTGNIKFDFELAADVAVRGRAFRDLCGADRPLWVAASTHAGEEESVLDAHEALLQVHPSALLLLVPRHPERFGEVAELLEARHIPFITRSGGQPVTPRTRVFLGDTMGELPGFYAAADVAFVGGSLVRIGGHNLLEPAALGLPVITGPHNENASDIAELLARAGAAVAVDGPEALAAETARLLGDPNERRRRGDAGRAVIAGNRGALERLLRLVEPLIR